MNPKIFQKNSALKVFAYQQTNVFWVEKVMHREVSALGRILNVKDGPMQWYPSPPFFPQKVFDGAIN